MSDDPAFTYENLKAYYRNRADSLWPAGVVPPVAAYPILTTLREEWDREIVAADHHRRHVMNALGQLKGAVDETPLRQAEDRMSLARLMVHTIDHDRSVLREKAQYEGQPLPA